MDPPADILALAAVEGSVAASVFAGERWGLSLDAVPGAAFHAITAGTAGTARLMLPGHPPRHSLPGDTVL